MNILVWHPKYLTKELNLSTVHPASKKPPDPATRGVEPIPMEATRKKPTIGAYLVRSGGPGSTIIQHQARVGLRVCDLGVPGENY